MLSETETNVTATAVVGNDAVEGCAATAYPAHECELFADRSPEGESFFYIAMRVSRPRARAWHRGRSHR
jgi:hypothetical protein